MAQTYAGLSDVSLYGLPIVALAPLTDAQKGACLAAAAGEMNAILRGRYTLPFVSYGVEFTEKNVIIGKYKMLMRRGFNPTAAADKEIKQDALEALKWCRDVVSQLIHPECVEDAILEGVQPLVFSGRPRGY